MRIELYLSCLYQKQTSFITVKMWQKYDTESDQLKCNFCTQWFKCTLHYANLQRYSLKACHKCLNNFTYTLLHPDTYHIYKVVLLDSCIALEQPSRFNLAKQNEVLLELQTAQQEVKDKIGHLYEEKVKKVIDEMEKAIKKVQEAFKRLQRQFDTKEGMQQQQANSKDFMKTIEQLKEYPLENWHWQADKTEKKPNLNRNASGYLGHSRKYSYHADKEKENHHPNRSGFCKTIKNKVAGLQDSKVKLKESQFLDLPPLYGERPKSLSKSSQHSNSRKRLDASMILSSLGGPEERDLAEIISLMQTNSQNGTYLPYELQPDNTIIIKNESKRTQADSIIDLRNRTAKGGQLIELIGADISKINFECYLKSLGAQPTARTVRIIKVGLTDYAFDSLLRFISQHSNIETLIVTNNRLTELSVMALQTFLAHNKESSLKHVYLGCNRIMRERSMLACRELNESGVEVYL